MAIALADFNAHSAASDLPQISGGHPVRPASNPAMCEGILLKVALASSGERNALLFWGACRLREMARDGKIALPVGNELLTEAALRAGLRSWR